MGDSKDMGNSEDKKNNETPQKMRIIKNIILGLVVGAGFLFIIKINNQIDNIERRVHYQTKHKKFNRI